MKSILLALVFGTSTVAEAAIIGYAGGAAQPGLYSINPANGAATFVTSVQRQLATGGLAYFNGSFYATNYTPQPGSIPPNTYGVLDVTNGSFSPIGTQTSSNWFGLTANASQGLLYVMDIDDNILRTLVPGGPIKQVGTGLGIQIPLGIRGMAYDNRHNILYATGYYQGDPHFYTIDTTTGLATDIGSLGLPFALHSLEEIYLSPTTNWAMCYLLLNPCHDLCIAWMFIAED